jgi:lipopolysaccharide transport system permease protein
MTLVSRGSVVETVAIEPPPALRFPNLREVYRYREMLWLLIAKSLSLRYKQTVLGVGWVVLKPLLMMLVYVLVFGTFLNRGSGMEGVPFPVFLFSAIIAWQFFSTTATECVSSVSRDREFMKKVYFPRIILPLVPIATHFVDLVASFAILVALMAAYGIAPGIELLTLPAFLLLLVLFSTGAALWLAPMNVRYRDIQYAVPFFIQLGFFMSPIVYSVQQLEASWRGIYHLNPLAGVIEGFRWSILGGQAPSLAGLGVSLAVGVVVLVTGLLHFGSRERDFVAEA